MTDDKDKFYLLDSNILVYAYNEDSPCHKKAKEIRNKSLSGEIKGCITPQNLYEFYAIVTDSRRANNPLTPDSAAIEVKNYYDSRIKKVYPLENTFLKVVELVKRYQITKQNIHDIHLLATMLDNGIDGIYTRNEEHFKRLCKDEGIELINPFN